MKVNFEIIDNYALSYEGRHIDLHNNFDFASLDYNVADREVKLSWKKSNNEWVDKHEFSSLDLIHKTVTFLKVINQDEKSSYDDNSILGEITFFPSSIREINDSFVSQSKPNESDDIIYSFENGQRIRINCEQIELKIAKEQNINLIVTKQEALVLFELLSRFNQTEHPEVFEDQAEQITLWSLETQLEKKLVESFNRNYKDIIKEARDQIRDKQ